MMPSDATSSPKRILIVDDDVPVVRALALRCRQLGLEVEQAHDASQAMAAAGRLADPPVALLLDLKLPGADGLTLCEMLRTHEHLRQVPVILLTGKDDDSVRRRCVQTGIHFVHKDVNAWRVLEPLITRLGSLDGAAESQKAIATTSPPADTKHAKPARKVLVVDDDPAITKSLRLRLENIGYTVLGADTGMEGYFQAVRETPDLILLDYKMPEAWGNTILGKLKTNPITRDIPVIILSGMSDVGVQRDILRLGAECWINKPFEARELIRLIKDKVGGPIPQAAETEPA